MTEESDRESVCLLDTTIQIDRNKTANRREQLERMLSEFDWVVTTGIGLVEFKAVLIQQLITIHNQMRRKDARFTRARDALLEKQHPQQALRAHIFNNLLNIYGSSFDGTPESDMKLATRARLQLENIIAEVYRWFKEESCDVFLNRQRLNCTRADEPPKKKKKVFDANLPKCKEGINRFCNVESLVQEEGKELLDLLNSLDEDNPSNAQLIKSRNILGRVFQDESFRMSVDQCRGAGDCLIALEGMKVATVALSTNSGDWSSICACSDLKFQEVRYEGEETHR